MDVFSILVGSMAFLDSCYSFENGCAGHAGYANAMIWASLFCLLNRMSFVLCEMGERDDL